MATWREMARENRTAANELFAARRWRSCASRAYYAVYDEVTHGLLQAGVMMPANQANPKHRTLPNLIGNCLAPLNPAVRWRLAGLAAGLYRFRIMADYLPLVTLDEADARIAMGLMTKAFVDLKGVP